MQAFHLLSYRELSVDERTITFKEKKVMAHYKRAKLAHWGFKLFFSANLRHGYTLDFSMYTGTIPSGRGLSYDIVISLLLPDYLG